MKPVLLVFGWMAFTMPSFADPTVGSANGLAVDPTIPKVTDQFTTGVIDLSQHNSPTFIPPGSELLGPSNIQPHLGVEPVPSTIYPPLLPGHAEEISPTAPPSELPNPNQTPAFPGGAP